MNRGMNWLRSIFLVGTLIGLGVHACLKWKPTWVMQVDQWLVHRYLASELDSLAADEVAAQGSLGGVKAARPSQAAIEEFWKRQPAIQDGDRHFPAWWKLGERMAQACQADGNTAEAVQWLDRLLEKKPNKLAIQLRKCAYWIEAGDRASLELAEQELERVHALFPEWEAVQDLMRDHQRVAANLPPSKL